MADFTNSILQVLEGNRWIGITALGVALVATPIVRWVAYRKQIVDRPDALLKPHGRPMAYLGGLAICAGLLAGLAVYVAVMPDLRASWNDIRQAAARGDIERLHNNSLLKILSIAVAAVWITLVGLLDDVHNLKPRQKIVGQALAAAILLAGGVGSGLDDVFFGPFGIALPFWAALPFQGLTLFVAMIVACNATNLLDGLDGLCGGVTGIIAVGYLALAVWLASFGRPYDVDNLRVGLCLAMAGAVLGFLPYNVPPASIFMGDAGSMLLGFFVATMLALFACEGTARWLLAACAIYALPILDTALAVVRRALAGKSIFAGDRSHLYDQLVDRGMTVKQVVALFYVLAVVAAVVGVAVAMTLKFRYAVILYAGLLVIIWTIFVGLGMVTPPPKQDGTGPGQGGADE